MANNVMLKGNLTQDPYYDVIPGSGRPFMRYYLAVDMRSGMALTFLLGNLTQAPYFDYVGGDERPFLRFYVAVNRPRHDGNGQNADFLRVVAYDERAQLDYAYLRPGSEVLVKGNLRARKRKLSGGKTQTVIEVVVADEPRAITFLHKIAWQEGDAARRRILAEREEAPNARQLHQEPGGGFFRVVSYDDRARLDYAYLRKGSEVFVEGRLRSRKRELSNGRRETVVEVVARKTTFLRNVEWERGDSARERALAAREVRV